MKRNIDNGILITFFKVTKISIPGIFLFYHFKIKIKGWHNSDNVSVAKFI